MGLFGGNSSVSKAQGSSNAVINSSGWVVGIGDAQGGDTAAGTPADSVGSIPWYGWAAVGSVVLAFIYFKKKKAK